MSKPTTSDSGSKPTASSEQAMQGRAGRTEPGSVQGDATTSDGYVVRPYRPGDRARFLELYDDVFDASRSEEWFSWRYGGPYADRPRMFVAERNGELVGAEPFISFSMRAGDEVELAIQPADAMVHPDHRRNGLLTRMTEQALDYFEDREPSFVFNFPNEEAKSAYLKLGWVEVGTVATAYRIHNPSAFFEAFGDRVDGVAGPAADSVVGSAADAGASAFNRLREVVAATGDGDAASAIDVRRRDGVPADRLSSLYESAIPDRIHTPRTEAFLDWRYANPNWSVRTYTAGRDGDLDAAIVTAVERSGDMTCLKLLDAFPLVGQNERSDAFDALVAAAVSDHADADVVATAEDTLPSPVLDAHGFFRDDHPPLSLFGSLTAVVARPLSLREPASWTVGDRTLPERRDWRLPFAEQDCS